MEGFMPQYYKNYIGGKWIEPETGEYFENRNPANWDEVIGLFPKSDARDVEKAIAAAKEAYKKWRLVPAPKRAEILFKLANLIKDNKEELARDMTREMGKILIETRGDVQEAIDMTFFIAGEGRRLYGHTTPSEMMNKFQMSIRIPVGLVAMITPWNFPMAIPSWKLIPALVCGNTVIFKPATDTPLSAYNLVKLCEEAGIPPGVVNLVTGSGSAVGMPLVKHPDIKIVSFTGSSEIGAQINQMCAPSFKKVSLEMGGKNAMIVMDDANLDMAVEGALWGAFGTTGQRCTATSRIVVHKDIMKQFVDKFVERAKALRVGNGLLPETQMGPCINKSQLETVEKYVEIGKKEGARLVCGGSRLTKGDYAKGWFHEPTIFVDVSPKMRIAQEEIFGPVVSIIEAKDIDHAIEIVNDSAYGLSSSIYTTNVNHAFKAIRDIYTGITYVNAPTIGAEVHLPFGGTNATGNGHREGGIQVLDMYSEWKSVYIDFSGKLQRAQIDT
jgi:aldehyde dehydrogenase (NAD+)